MKQMRFRFLAETEDYTRIGYLNSVGYPYAKGKKPDWFVCSLNNAKKEADKRADLYTLNTGVKVKRIIFESPDKLKL